MLQLMQLPLQSTPLQTPENLSLVQFVMRLLNRTPKAGSGSETTIKSSSSHQSSCERNLVSDKGLLLIHLDYRPRRPCAANIAAMPNIEHIEEQEEAVEMLAEF